jgi:hypothetical protein
MEELKTTTEFGLQTVIQYGFAGFAVLQLGVIFWLVKSLLGSLDKNTRAFIELINMLNDRPCLKNDSALKNRE